MDSCRLQPTRWYRAGLILLFISNSVAAVNRSSSRVDLVIGGLDLYPAQIAFNNSIRNLAAANLKLMLPPLNHSDLCEYPEEAIRTASRIWEPRQGMHKNANYSNYTANPIAMPTNHAEPFAFLLSNNGSCHPLQQARVALELQRNFTLFGRVTHLIIYRQDDYQSDDGIENLTSIPTFIDHQDPGLDPNLDGIGVVFVATRTGQEIYETIQGQVVRLSFAEPYFLQKGNELWDFSVSFVEPTTTNLDDDAADDIDYNDNYHGPGYPPPQAKGGSHPEPDNFYWFRLVVFCILVVSPCLRAVYLWYAGGARIRFRYNEQGRIIGLQYIPPMPYWFARRPDESYSHPPSRMTREEVMALPELVYRPPALVAEQSPQPETTDTTNEYAAADESNKQSQEKDAATGKNPEIATDDNAISVTDVEDPTPCIHFSSEMSTTCSICIDDFEEGERLRMLPRCRHVFHTDCILPWLTERQGCCPLCKTEVVEPEHSENDSHSHDDQDSVDYGTLDVEAQERSSGAQNEGDPLASPTTDERRQR